MTMEYARRYPILTIACGPTNSIRGASYLSKLQNAIVIDVGGTTTDLGVITELVEDSVDAMKVSSGDVDIILVGGGSIVLPAHLKGAKTVIKPAIGGVANAIGSAISKVSGNYEKLVDYLVTPREQALEEAKAEAVELAVLAGAVRDKVRCYILCNE